MKDLRTTAVPMVMTAVFLVLALVGFFTGWSFAFVLGLVGAFVYTIVMMMMAVRIWRR